MEAKREQEHFLVLKVMRLTKPTLYVNHPITCDSRDLPGLTFHNVFEKDVSVLPSLPSFSMGELLTLPQNFGNIYLGETFSCYVSVHNDTTALCQDITIKADLQTSSQRISLNLGKPSEELGADEGFDAVIHHEVKEMGTHILICQVTYSCQGGEKLHLKKFFKFQVFKPLDVKTKSHNIESDDVYLEAQIQNITPGVICLEQVVLEPSAQYLCTDISGSGSEENAEDSALQPTSMQTMDTRQFLFHLQPHSEADSKTLKGVTNLGRLNIAWKTNFGEKGRLITSTLQRVVPGYGDVRVTVEAVPATVDIQVLFTITVKVVNCSDRAMELELLLQNSVHTGLAWCDISGRNIGKLEVGAQKLIDLKLLPLLDGLQAISGVRVKELFLNRTYELDDTIQVFVRKTTDQELISCAS